MFRLLGGKAGGIVRMDAEHLTIRWYLGDLNAEELPSLAIAALERGCDGKYLRLLAGLVKPTRNDVEDIVDGALRELGGPAPLSKDDAARLLVKRQIEKLPGTALTRDNLIEEILHSLPELEKRYIDEVKAKVGVPGNYQFVFNVLRPALEERIATGDTNEFLERFSTFVERACVAEDREPINVIWVEIFEWIIRKPPELKFLWPAWGPRTKATIKDAARRSGVTKNLPQES
jgi:hypothetical protein